MSELVTLFETREFWVFSKPTGLHSTNDGKSKHSLVSHILTEHPSQQRAGKDAGLIHRLDFETSGCVLVLKSEYFSESQRTAYMTNEMLKRYILLTEGMFRSTTVQTGITSRYRRSKKVQVVSVDEQSKRTLSAKTIFTVLDHPFPDTSLVCAEITAGRRHQIRAHAAYLKHPLVGDSLYGSLLSLADTLKTKALAPKFFLHAYQLEFRHPETGALISVTAPIPEYAQTWVPETSILLN